MGVEINIGGTKIGDRAEVLNSVFIRGNNVKVNVLNSEINGQAAVLEDLKVDSILEDLKKAVQQMDKDSEEYLEVQKILRLGRGDDKSIMERIKKHLLEFSQGVLASIVANMIT